MTFQPDPFPQDKTAHTFVILHVASNYPNTVLGPLELFASALHHGRNRGQAFSYSLGFRVQGSRFGGYSIGFRVLGFALRVQGLWCVSPVCSGCGVAEYEMQRSARPPLLKIVWAQGYRYTF